MSEFFKLLLPVLLQILPQLFNKQKSAMSKWFADGTKAALAEKKPWSAFWMGSMQCAVDGMDDEQYASVRLAVENAGEAAAAMAAKAAAARKGEG